MAEGTKLAKAYVQIIPTTENLSANLTRSISGDVSSAGDKAGQNFGSKMVSAIKTAIAAAGIGTIVKNAINGGAELEQNLGGSEAVWGDYAASIQATSTEAWANMGMSASDYLATANKVGALMQGSGMDQAQAFELTSEAMQRAADVASVMGIDTSSAMEAIAGAAKGNFTMMDNLGVAMNATTLEAYAHAQGMEDFTYATASTTEKTALAMQMFMEQTEQYAGNFAKESADTISGSMGAVSSAWSDLLANITLGNDVDLSPLITSIVNVANNLLPAISNVLVQLPNALVSLVTSLAPTLTQSGMTMLISLINGFATSLPTMMPMLTQCVLDIVAALVANAPALIQAAIAFITAFVDGLISSIDLIIEALPTLITAILDALAESFSLFIEAGIQLFTSLIQALPTIISNIVSKLPEILTSLINYFIDNIPLLIEAGFQMFVALITNLPQIISALISAALDIITSLINAFKNNISRFVQMGKNLLLGLRDGIKGAVKNVIASVKSACNEIVGKVKEFFGIGSPSKLFAEYGGFLMEGFANGIDDNGSLVTDSINSVNSDIANGMAYDLGSTASLSMSGYESGSTSVAETLKAALTGGDRDIVLRLDGKTLARATYKYNQQVSTEHGLSLVNV